jgi:hypothetical protein
MTIIFFMNQPNIEEQKCGICRECKKFVPINTGQKYCHTWFNL